MDIKLSSVSKCCLTMCLMSTNQEKTEGKACFGLDLKIYTLLLMLIPMLLLYFYMLVFVELPIIKIYKLN